MEHIVLLGDSIFDNGVYVPGELAVIEQLRSEMPDAWEATLLAVDGDVTSDIRSQLKNLPTNASDCVISSGGNDALGHAHQPTILATAARVKTSWSREGRLIGLASM